MPFKSDKQRRFMFANHPTIARRWANEEKTMAPKKKAATAADAVRAGAPEPTGRKAPKRRKKSSGARKPFGY